jgi:hypothetical protein
MEVEVIETCMGDVATVVYTLHSQDGGCGEVMETVCGDVAIMSVHYTAIIEAALYSPPGRVW